MANWNLSVDLRGRGTSLDRALRQSAREARSLATAARQARTEVQSLGTASRTTTGHMRALGNATRTANRNLTATARQARETARQLRQVATAATQADARLRALNRNVRVRVRLDNNTRPGIAAVRASIAGLRRLDPVRMRVEVDADATAAAAALTAAQQAARRASITLRALATRARAAARELDDLATSATGATTTLTGLAAAARAASTSLRSVSGDTRTLRRDVDDLNDSLNTLTGRLGALPGTLGGLTGSTTAASSSSKKLLQTLLLLSTALIPIAASIAPIAAGLGAGTVAVGVFGLALAGQIKAMSTASEAQQKYQDAVRESGKGSTEAAAAEKEYLAQLRKMPPETRRAVAALQVFKTEYKDWSNSLAGDTMPVAIKSMGTMQALLPKLTPLVRGTAGELDHMMTVLAGGTQSAGFTRFMDTFTRFATDTLAKATSGMVAFTRSMSDADTRGGWAEFWDYARQNAPLVGDALSELATSMSHIIIAASDMGVSVLQVLEAVARAFNSIPTEVLSTALTLYTTLKLVSMGVAALSAVTGGAAAARLAAYFAVMRAAGIGTTLRATAASMSAVSKATIGLGVLAIAAIGIDKLAQKARGAPPDVDKLTTSLKNLARTGEFTGEMKKTFGDIDGFVEKLETLKKKTAELEETREGGATGLGRIPILDDVGDWLSDRISDIDEGQESIKALEEDFKGFDEAMARLATSGYGEQAAKDFSLIKEALKGKGYSDAEINDLVPKYRAAVENLKAEQALAAAGMGLFGEQALAVKQKLDAQRQSADGLRGAIQALNDVNRAALGGMIGFEASIDAAATAAKENAGSLKMVNGELDLNSPKAQAAATALQDLGAKTDEAAAAARASGKPWEDVNAIYQRGKDSIVQFGQQMGLTKDQARLLAEQILTIPADKTFDIEMNREDAIAGLDQVIAKIEATPGQKSVTVDALTANAMALLNSLGYKTETLPNGSVRVTANTGQAISGLAAVKGMRDSLRDKTITITTNYVVTGNQARRSGAHGSQLANADGSITDYYANGGIQQGGLRHFANGAENHVAQIAPAGTWRVWAEPETGGEAYVPLAPGKRARSRAITEETIRRLGGDPSTVQWNADGAVTDWRYDPSTGSLYSPGDIAGAGRKTKQVKGKEVSYYDLGAVEKKLHAAARATQAWNRDLQKVADRAGGDVADALAAMGDEGVALAKKMANGSDTYIRQMSESLRKLSEQAKASLTDYTRQLTSNNKLDAEFSKNLSILAGRGYGDLAAQLAAQNDTAAQQLAAAAVQDNKKAAGANAAARTANSQLTSDEVQTLVSIIAAIKNSKTGIHAVADTTGIGEDEIVSIATKAKAQISSSLGSRAQKFLADLARAQKGLSFANGGIRAGLYATRAGAVTFAEPETGGEAYVPLGAHKRRHAMPVLRDVARRFGVGLTDATGGRQVVVIRQSGDTHVTVQPVRSEATASDIGAQVGRSVRRANRGGVNARA